MERTRDRMSELPDTIRLHILSLLPRKAAIRASTLSRKWKDLWKYRWPYPTSLDFGREFATGLSQEDFVSSVNRILYYRGNKKVEIFQLFFYPGTRYQSDAVGWIDYAIANGVEELYADFSEGHRDYYTGNLAKGRTTFELPDCVLSSESVTLLNLKYCNFRTPLEFKRLRFLETLSLKCVNITDDMVTNIIASCPLLEKLVLWQCLQLRCIKVTAEDSRLKSLVVVNCWRAYEIEIDAPNLCSFHFNGDFLQRYEFKNVSSLTDVMICSTIRETGRCHANWVRIASYLANIKVLTLCSSAIQHIAVSMGSTPMVFGNLQELQLLMEQMTESNLSDVYGFFGKCQCPCLNKIFIELPHENRDPSMKIFLARPAEEPLICDFGNLKTIKMNSFKGHKNEMELMKFFLENATMLELMVLVIPEEAVCEEGTSYSKTDPLCWFKHITTMPLYLLNKASAEAKVVICSNSEDDSSLHPTHYNELVKV